MGKALRIVASLFLAAASAWVVHAQSMAAANSADSDPFAAFHAELDRAADTALADAVQRMADAARDDRNHTLPRSPESLVTDFDQHYRPTATIGVTAAMKRLDQLRPVVEPILQSEGIPVELTSVAIVESGGRPNALSPKGALGLWQLMPDTARRYGLIVDRYRDERLDLEESTRAAASYLRDLYQQFGSWPLALASYNAGEQALQRAILRGGTADFVQLSSLRLLPQETCNYVPAVLSAMQLLGIRQHPGALIRATKILPSPPVFAVPGGQPSVAAVIE
ncbi:MAG TPA: lytic transglycosylase domain-containing protein [Terriglobales bacterium]|nr:lytic transglycosylase domain-containing protein [Terriglobales bacterium]